MLLISKTVTVGDGDTPTLYNVIGVNKWIVIAVLAAVFYFLFSRASRSRRRRRGTPGRSWGFSSALWPWRPSGRRSILADRARGLSFTGPLREFFLTVSFGNYMNDPASIVATESRSLLGITFSWSSLYVLTVPIGAYLSGKLLNEVKLKVPPADELLKVLFGGFIMGIGAQIGGGCNIGHGLTGVSTLAVSSWVSTTFIILGNWTMVYFLLIKPMQDMDV